MKDAKLCITATSDDKAAEMLNKYYYSTTYRIKGDSVLWKDGEAKPDMFVVHKGGRVRVYRRTA
jgi:hypothetical protein